MEATVSVSKGVFLLRNQNTKKKQKTNKNTTLFEKVFRKEAWYSAYRKNWKYIENKIKELNHTTYSALLNDIVSYIHSFGQEGANKFDGIIPSATLLTGVNQPDHVSQFMALKSKIRAEVTPHIAMVNSQDAPTLKHLIENTVWQFINGNELEEFSEDPDSSMQEASKKLKKSQCTMPMLLDWYSERFNAKLSPLKRKCDSNRLLVVVIPDFESFSSSVLQDFVLIASSYIDRLPLVFVFGVATSVSALHKSFPYHVSSKVMIKVFHTHSSPVYMNQVLEDIFLSHSSPFHLSGRAFELLTDVFLFYDFSVTGLVQGIKYCMMDHYYGDNTRALCCPPDQLAAAIATLTPEDLESIRRLPSFRPYLEAQNPRVKVKLFEDDDYFKEALREGLGRLRDYMRSFYACLRLLRSFLADLPKSLLGKSVRELYTRCALEPVTLTPSFKEAMQYLKFQSQTKLVETLKGTIKILNADLNSSLSQPLTATPTKNAAVKSNPDAKELGEGFLKSVRVNLTIFLGQVQNASVESEAREDMDVDEDAVGEDKPENRYKLKEKLLKAATVDRLESEYEMVRGRLISYLEDVCRQGLAPPHSQAFHEIYYFSDVASVKKHIVGSPRGAVHMALNNPEYYLQCQCCRLSSTDAALSTLPPTSLAYKLHRECGKHINLYDWLQAFAAVLGGEEGAVDPAVQSSFSRAVAELQMLGFIKTSKRKTDHVMRLTW